MTDAKFTKGPWVRSHEANGVQKVLSECDKLNDGFYICTPCGPDDVANAHLIAAAPEMYAALRDILENYECGEGVDTSIRMLLAKARGEG